MKTIKAIAIIASIFLFALLFFSFGEFKAKVPLEKICAESETACKGICSLEASDTSICLPLCASERVKCLTF